MFNEIYELIKQYDNIIIARHIGVDPDAMAASFGLKNSILLTFPKKSVKIAGTGSNRFGYFGKYDKPEAVREHTLLIVVDTPDTRRIDGIEELTKYEKIVKMDHHPFIEKFADIEYIDDQASSAAQIVLEFLNETPMLMDNMIASQLFWGIISDTNRFMYSNSITKAMHLTADLIKKYDLDVTKLYASLYARPLQEVRLEGYIAQNLVLTENHVAYIKITDKVLQEYHVDAASPGNMIGNFNYIDEILVWIFVTEDVKNNNIRVSIRSRGPVINTTAEKYNGGGHKFASGAKLKTLDEADPLINDLDAVCKKYLKEQGVENNED